MTIFSRFSMPRTPLRELKPELFEDEYKTDSDDDGDDSSGNLCHQFQSNLST